MKFSDSDIIVFNGVITTVGIAKLLTDRTDDFRLVNDKEKLLYFNRPWR